MVAKGSISAGNTVAVPAELRDHESMAIEMLGNPEIIKAIAADLGDWRKLAQPIAARYRVDGAVQGAAFVAAIAEAAVAGGREPEVRLGRGFVDVSLVTVDEDNGERWVTAADLALARTISGLARERGLVAVPGEVAQLELALDTADYEVVGPFWAALLTGDPGNTVRDSVFDPTDRVPTVWFQGTDTHPTPRQRWHFDLWLAPEVADARIAAAVAAGGTVVDATYAPSFTVLADPDGNRVCICTALERD